MTVIKTYSHDEILQLIKKDLSDRRDKGEFAHIPKATDGFDYYTRAKFNSREGVTIMISTTERFWG